MFHSFIEAAIRISGSETDMTHGVALAMQTIACAKLQAEQRKSLVCETTLWRHC